MVSLPMYYCPREGSDQFMILSTVRKESKNLALALIFFIILSVGEASNFFSVSLIPNQKKSPPLFSSNLTRKKNDSNVVCFSTGSASRLGSFSAVRIPGASSKLPEARKCKVPVVQNQHAMLQTH